MADAETSAPPLEKPLPSPGAAKRPGTSGTELNLRANRRAASTAYQRAQRAEATYRAKRQATSARADIAAAKTHFKESGMQFLAGWKRGISAVKCVPGVLQEKKGAWQSRREVKSQEKALAKQRKLAEKMKMAAADGEGTPAAEATPAEPAAA